MGELAGKVAVVTGASKGIGAGIAKYLAAAGAAVAVNYASSREGADKVVAEITAKGGKAIAVHGDVAKKADIKSIFETTLARFGRLDILVNNAGVYRFDPLEAVTEAEFHREFDINVLGMILATQEAVKHFGAEGGSVINLTSVAGTSAIPGSVVYSATKAAIDSLTRVLAAELGPKKIRVNAIAPGVTVTEGYEALGELAKNFESYALAQTPLGRVAQPEDIAKVAVFLASDQSAWITGERIAASGGLR
ncbi:glucose 1-dehydrogenase [uncultured Methylovirgula sp.]|uniref:SDR family NAD(P)-dependent oxidoreductase n=1 Tax=uncultured Methylovirgula sp. TaxID=1285960 RepID=UPI00261F261F|nr:glucose 1-dehydrogenase [uncultured Methylovirgula sp.]